MFDYEWDKELHNNSYINVIGLAIIETIESIITLIFYSISAIVIFIVFIFMLFILLCDYVYSYNDDINNNNR